MVVGNEGGRIALQIFSWECSGKIWLQQMNCRRIFDALIHVDVLVLRYMWCSHGRVLTERLLSSIYTALQEQGVRFEDKGLASNLALA